MIVYWDAHTIPIRGIRGIEAALLLFPGALNVADFWDRFGVDIGVCCQGPPLRLLLHTSATRAFLRRTPPPKKRPEKGRGNKPKSGPHAGSTPHIAATNDDVRGPPHAQACSG